MAEVEQVSEQAAAPTALTSAEVEQVGDRQVNRGLERAGSVLAAVFPEVRISKRRLRLAESIQLVREHRDRATQQLGFASRPFVLCGLPVRHPPPSTLLYERRNGLFTLLGHWPSGLRPALRSGPPSADLPGDPCRAAAEPDDSLPVRFGDARYVWACEGREGVRRLIAAFERIFGATIFFGTDSTRRQRARVIQRSRFNFFREAQIWYNRGSSRLPISEEFENVIVLSDEFYQETMAHPIPTDLHAVKVFAGAPAVLDLFMWLSYRCFTAKQEERIPLFGDFGLTAQLGSVEYSRPRRFRAMLEQWLGQIRMVWPQCPAQICSDGRYLFIRSAQAVLSQPKI